MPESESVSYSSWVENFSAADPQLIILTSKDRHWSGLENDATGPKAFQIIDACGAIIIELNSQVAP